MDNRLTPKQQDVLLEDGLKSQSLVPMPRSITVNVMARIQVEQRPALVTWVDFVIALVIALTIGALFITYQNLPPFVLAKLRIQSILIYQDILVNARWLVPAIFFSLAAFLSALAIPYLRKELMNEKNAA